VDANPAALKSWNKNLFEIIGRTDDEIFPNYSQRYLRFSLRVKSFLLSNSFQHSERYSRT